MSTSTNTQPWTETKKTVPASALCFNLGAFQFAEKSSDGKRFPVKLVGRTGKPIAHWFWGNVVHDMAGMQLHKDTLPIDYCHLPDEVIGYLDKFDTTSGDLIATGALVPFTDGDRANEVHHKSREKVPYEASINFGGGPLRLEELEPGASDVVNGNLVTGPALIIRQWTLRGIAVCPYGADMNTRTELSDDGAGTKPSDTSVEVTLFKVGQMSQQQDVTNGKINATADKPAAAGGGNPAELAQVPGTAPVPPKPEAATPPKPGAEFVAAFGDVGARWYLEGKAFAACAAEHAGNQQKRIAELEGEVSTLKQQVADLPRGNEAASFKAGPKGDAKPLPKGVNGGAAAVMAQAMGARGEPAK